MNDLLCTMQIGLWLAVVVYLGAGFIAWKQDGKRESFWCYHDLVTGGGCMGDGVDCLKCGLTTYDGFAAHMWLFKLLGRVDRTSKPVMYIGKPDTAICKPSIGDKYQDLVTGVVRTFNGASWEGPYELDVSKLKLVQVPRVTMDVVELSLKTPVGNMRAALGMRLREEDQKTMQFAGKANFGDAVISGAQMELYNRIPELTIDGYILHGVLPMRELEPGTYGCVIDYFEKVQNEPESQSAVEAAR